MEEVNHAMGDAIDNYVGHVQDSMEGDLKAIRNAMAGVQTAFQE